MSILNLRRRIKTHGTMVFAAVAILSGCSAGTEHERVRTEAAGVPYTHERLQLVDMQRSHANPRALSKRLGQ